jgi:hypothetical protein
MTRFPVREPIDMCHYGAPAAADSRRVTGHYRWVPGRRLQEDGALSRRWYGARVEFTGSRRSDEWEVRR